jgi:hypothetical protein
MMHGAILVENLKTVPPLIVALKIDTKDFFRNWSSDNCRWSRFNRWYSDLLRDSLRSASLDCEHSAIGSGT